MRKQDGRRRAVQLQRDHRRDLLTMLENVRSSGDTDYVLEVGTVDDFIRRDISAHQGSTLPPAVPPSSLEGDASGKNRLNLAETAHLSKLVRVMKNFHLDHIENVKDRARVSQVDKKFEAWLVPRLQSVPRITTSVARQFFDDVIATEEQEELEARRRAYRRTIQRYGLQSLKASELMELVGGSLDTGQELGLGDDHPDKELAEWLLALADDFEQRIKRKKVELRQHHADFDAWLVDMGRDEQEAGPVSRMSSWGESLTAAVRRKAAAQVQLTDRPGFDVLAGRRNYVS